MDAITNVISKEKLIHDFHNEMTQCCSGRPADIALLVKKLYPNEFVCASIIIKRI